MSEQRMEEGTVSPSETLEVTELAAGKLLEALQAENQEDHAIRVVCRRFGASRFEYSLDFAAPNEKGPHDLEIVSASGVKIWLDPDSARHLVGVTIDYQESPETAGFKFHNPAEAEGWKDPVATRFQTLLDEQVNPGVASHGGYIELLDYNDGTAYVKMGGGCQGCGMASVTLRQGIEQLIAEHLPEVQSIVDTTDHAAGTNPYYAPGK